MVRTDKRDVKQIIVTSEKYYESKLRQTIWEQPKYEQDSIILMWPIHHRRGSHLIITATKLNKRYTRQRTFVVNPSSLRKWLTIDSFAAKRRDLWLRTDAQVSEEQIHNSKRAKIFFTCCFSSFYLVRIYTGFVDVYYLVGYSNYEYT